LLINNFSRFFIAAATSLSDIAMRMREGMQT